MVYNNFDLHQPILIILAEILPRNPAIKSRFIFQLHLYITGASAL